MDPYCRLLSHVAFSFCPSQGLVGGTNGRLQCGEGVTSVFTTDSTVVTLRQPQGRQFEGCFEL